MQSSFNTSPSLYQLTPYTGSLPKAEQTLGSRNHMQLEMYRISHHTKPET